MDRRRASGSTWSSTGWTRWPRCGWTARSWARPATSTGLPVRRHCRAAARRATNWPSTSPPPDAYAEAVRARVGDRPGAYPATVQLHPQDGLQLRLGLGTRPGHRRHLAGVRLERWRTARLAGCARWSDGRRRRRRVAVHVEVEPGRRARRRPVADRAGRRGRPAPRRSPAGATSAPSVVDWCAGRRAVVAARLRRPAAATTSTSSWHVAGDAAGPLDPADRLPHRRAGTEPDATARRSCSSSTAADLRQGRQLDPGRLLPAPDRPARGTPPRLGQAADANINLLRVWGGGMLRERRLLRRVRRGGAAGLAGLPVRLRRLPRGGAAARRGRGRGRETRGAADARTRAWCCGTATTRTSGASATGAGRTRCDGRTWGAGYYLELLPAVVAELDPTRPYWPGSPYSGRRTLHPNDPTHGTTHIWDVWNRRDYTAYRDVRPAVRRRVRLPGRRRPGRRCAGPSHDEPLPPDSPGVLAPQKAERRQRQARPRAGAAPARARTTSTTGTA